MPHKVDRQHAAPGKSPSPPRAVTKVSRDTTQSGEAVLNKSPHISTVKHAQIRQRNPGNRRVHSTLQHDRESSPPALNRAQTPEAVAGHSPLTHRSVTVSDPDSYHERQARELAALVVSASPPNSASKTQKAKRAHTPAPIATTTVQRCEGGCGPIPCDHASKSPVAFQQSGPPFLSQAEHQPSMLETHTLVDGALTSPSRTLPADDQAFMESRLDADFGNIRIHDNPLASQSADALAARAYTVGNHIVFAADAYQPGGDEGRELLAHELVHTIQQSGGSPNVRSSPFSTLGETTISKLPTESYAIAATSQVQRNGGGGGPYHPPKGLSTSCSMTDTCSSLSLKINYLRHTIKRHEEWDRDNPRPGYPRGRHYDEIQDLRRALVNCLQIAKTKCTGQPVVVPVPQEQEQEEEQPQSSRRWTQVEHEIMDALPYVVAIAALALVAVCFASGVCEIAALVGALGAGAAAIVVDILDDAGVETVGGVA